MSILKYIVHKISATQYGAALEKISFQYLKSNLGDISVNFFE